VYVLFSSSLYEHHMAQLVKYDVHTTRKIKSLHAIFYPILLFYEQCSLHLQGYREKSTQVPPPQNFLAVFSAVAWNFSAQFYTLI